MNIFGKKANGDYFVEMIKTLTEIKSDGSHLKEKFEEHSTAEYERRKIDREWQKEINTTLAEAIECPKADQIDTIQTNVDTLTKDKTRREGKFLGVKSVYVVGVGILGFAALVLGILWRLKVI